MTRALPGYTGSPLAKAHVEKAIREAVPVEIGYTAEGCFPYETLCSDKLEVVAHADIEDKAQTVTFSEKPEIKTTATVDGEKKTESKDEVTIKDTCSLHWPDPRQDL